MDAVFSNNDAIKNRITLNNVLTFEGRSFKLFFFTFIVLYIATNLITSNGFGSPVKNLPEKPIFARYIS